MTVSEVGALDFVCRRRDFAELLNHALSYQWQQEVAAASPAPSVVSLEPRGKARPSASPWGPRQLS